MLVYEKKVEDLQPRDVILVDWATKDGIDTWTRTERVRSVNPSPMQPGFVVLRASQDLGPANEYLLQRGQPVTVSIDFTDRELVELVSTIYKKRESIRKDKRRKIQPSVRAIWMTELERLLDKLQAVKSYRDRMNNAQSK